MAKRHLPAEVNDIVLRLRESVRACRALDRSALLTEAADEIERLRRLTTASDSPHGNHVHSAGQACSATSATHD